MKRNLKYLAVLVIGAPTIHLFVIPVLALMIYNDRKRDQRNASN
jgi:hypothetical protein